MVEHMTNLQGTNPQGHRAIFDLHHCPLPDENDKLDNAQIQQWDLVCCPGVSFGFLYETYELPVTFDMGDEHVVMVE